ncbi:hypothetical protein ABZ172_01510 [Streptomyces sp. NPDC006296]|uniref:hypothetical protein n=1 Tax=Streptomyces sp. NPDC006296 TaxID=3156746 RepID=UPI0033A859C0
MRVLEFVTVGGVSPGGGTVGLESVEPAGKFAVVGVGDLEGEEEGLGCDSADAAGAAAFNSFVVLRVAVEVLFTVPKAELVVDPGGEAVVELLPVTDADGLGEGEGLTAADLGVSCRGRGDVDEGKAGRGRGFGV